MAARVLLVLGVLALAAGATAVRTVFTEPIMIESDGSVTTPSPEVVTTVKTVHRRVFYDADMQQGSGAGGPHAMAHKSAAPGSVQPEPQGDPESPVSESSASDGAQPGQVEVLKNGAQRIHVKAPNGKMVTVTIGPITNAVTKALEHVAFAREGVIEVPSTVSCGSGGGDSLDRLANHVDNLAGQVQAALTTTSRCN